MKKLLYIILIILIFSVPGITVNAAGIGNAQIVSNGNTTFLIEPDGNVKGWGRNDKGELGIGTTEDEHSPVVVNGLSDISVIVPASVSRECFFAIDYDGYVYSWGYNGYGQLGLGSTSNQLTPAQIPSLSDVKEIVINDLTVYAITSNGDVYAWGKNDYGQVGSGSKTTQTTPYKINGLSSIKDIICGEQTVFALTEDGYVYAWGYGGDFQMGNGEYVSAQTTPLLIENLSHVDEVITNGETSFAICDNYQEIYSWGEGWQGELGTYSERNRTPKRVSILSDLDEQIDKLIIKQNNCFVITDNNVLYGWGDGGYSQLGNGSTYDKYIPVVIPDVPSIKDVTFNGYTTVALGTDGCVYAWGRNLQGTAGTGNTSIVRTPQSISGLSNIMEIYNGGNAVYAINSDGEVYSWGRNDSGQLGIGTTSYVSPPNIIEAISGTLSIKKTEDTVFAIDAQGVIYGWGDNNYGQIGDGTLDDMLSPYTIYNNVMKTVTGTGDVLSTVPIMGSINALEISVTHPLNISYLINPNIEESFVCPDIEIQNNSLVPVKITIESFIASSEGDIVFEDVMPDSFDWDTLSLQESQQYIALGLDYADESQWLKSQPIMPLYAAEIDNNYIGALASGGVGSLKLYCKHGLAFDGSYSSMHELILVVSLL